MSTTVYVKNAGKKSILLAGLTEHRQLSEKIAALEKRKHKLVEELAHSVFAPDPQDGLIIGARVNTNLLAFLLKEIKPEDIQIK